MPDIFHHLARAAKTVLLLLPVSFLGAIVIYPRARPPQTALSQTENPGVLGKSTSSCPNLFSDPSGLSFCLPQEFKAIPPHQTGSPLKDLAFQTPDFTTNSLQPGHPPEILSGMSLVFSPDPGSNPYPPFPVSRRTAFGLPWGQASYQVLNYPGQGNAITTSFSFRSHNYRFTFYYNQSDNPQAEDIFGSILSSLSEKPLKP